MDLSIFFFKRYVEHENHRKMDGKGSLRTLSKICRRDVSRPFGANRVRLFHCTQKAAAAARAAPLVRPLIRRKYRPSMYNYFQIDVDRLVDCDGFC